MKDKVLGGKLTTCLVRDDLVLNPGSRKVWEIGGRAQDGPKCRTLTLAVLLGLFPTLQSRKDGPARGSFDEDRFGTMMYEAGRPAQDHCLDTQGGILVTQSFD